MAAVAVLAVAYVAVRAVPLPESLRAAEPACALPVELHDGRVACASDFAACGPLAPGSRVRLDDAGCTLLPEGMSAPVRLLYGVPIDLNRAGAADLELLPGLGPKLAAAIVAEREAHGPYRGFRDLTRVRGIGMATAFELQPYVTAGR